MTNQIATSLKTTMTNHGILCRDPRAADDEPAFAIIFHDGDFGSLKPWRVAFRNDAPARAFASLQAAEYFTLAEFIEGQAVARASQPTDPEAEAQNELDGPMGDPDRGKDCGEDGFQL